MDWKSKQNSDGGWAYTQGGVVDRADNLRIARSVCHRHRRPEFRSGLEVLSSTQRRDGGWSPLPGVEESTWVTALAAFLPERADREGTAAPGGPLAERADGAGIRAGATGCARESRVITRISLRLAMVSRSRRLGDPTSFGILAFEKLLATRDDDRALRGRIADAREFLFRPAVRRRRMESRI